MVKLRETAMHYSKVFLTQCMWYLGTRKLFSEVAERYRHILRCLFAFGLAVRYNVEYKCINRLFDIRERLEDNESIKWCFLWKHPS